MAMQGNTKRRDDERNTATHLIVSSVHTPAIKWITSPLFKVDDVLNTVWENGILLKHQWGGLKYEDVVIPMGRIVSVGDPTSDYIMDEFVNTIALPGMVENGNWIGIAPFNFIHPAFQEDQFGGNQPTVITNDVVEIPYIPQVAAAATFDKVGLVEEETKLTRTLKNPWGCAINPTGKEADGIVLSAGDYVRMTPSGRFTKWIKGTDDIDLRVGKILAVDWNQNKHGLLNWLLWSKEDLVADAPYTKNGFPPQDGWGYDKKYRDIKLKQAGYITPNMTVSDMSGIPGLHDGTGQTMGFGINDTNYSDLSLDPAFTGTQGATYVFMAKGPYGEDVKQIVEGSVTVKLNGAEIQSSDAEVMVDHLNGKISITCLSAISGALTCNLKKKYVGIPSYADFVGVVGTIKVQLIPR